MKRGEADGTARRVPLLLAVGAIGTGACAAGLMACSAILDWSGFTSADAGVDTGHVDTTDASDDARDDAPPDDGGIVLADAPPLVNCGTAQLCSPPVPSNAPGWSGPYALSLGAPGKLPACDTGSYLSQPAFEGSYDLKADTPQCGCSCSRPQGIGCDGPKVNFYTDSTCTMLCEAGAVNGCLVIPSCGTFLSIGSPTPDGGTCTPDASAVVPPTSWAGAARVCQPSPSATHGSCGQDKLCLPAATPYCLMFAGDAGDTPCPQGSYYAHRHVLYTGVNDQRGCSSCTCSSPTGASCSFPTSSPVPPVGSFDPSCTVYSGNPFFSPAPCTARVSPSDLAFKLLVDAGVEGGSCQPSAVAPLDAGAVPTGATTLCCTQ
jgi:hypothetical protein